MRIISVLGAVLLLTPPCAVAQEKEESPPQDEVKLPASVGDVCVGGGGRLLILHLPELRKLAVFDAGEAKVVKYVPAADDKVKFAAGADKLLVALPGDKVIERWSLKTFEREASAAVPVKGGVAALCMGSASHGPLYVGVRTDRGGAAHFLDPDTLKPIDVKVAKGELPGDGAYVRASADGTVFAMRNGIGGEPHTVATVVFEGEKSAAVHEAWISGSVLTPSPGGRFVYTSEAVYGNQMGLVHPKNPPRRFAKPYVAAASGGYYMRLDFKQWDQLGGSLAFFLEGSDRPFARLNDVEGVSNEQIGHGKNRDKLTPDQRVFFIPGAKLVVSIPSGERRLVLRRFDLEKELDKAGIDYLLVTSQPPTKAVRGEAYRYEMVVKSRKGEGKCKLDSGPDGMKVTAEGKLTWDVPKNFAEASVVVIVSVTDSSGQETFHTFKVAVRDRAEPQR
jgi:hypothetical protein